MPPSQPQKSSDPNVLLSKHSTLKLNTPLHGKNPPNLVLKPVTSEADVSSIATVNERALDADSAFKQWMALFTERNEWDTTVQAVTEALTDPEYRLVKAVVDEDGEEKIVGFIHWFCGYIQLEKYDPFAKKTEPTTAEPRDTATDPKDVASNIAEELSSTATNLEEKSKPTEADLVRARRLKKGERKYIQTRNHYISAIRGKCHMFIRRIMVLPEYQGMGIGRKLMQVVTDEADQLKIVCWLFARPMGVGLYERVGYTTFGVTSMDEPEEGFECDATRSMIRVAQPIREEGVS